MNWEQIKKRRKLKSEDEKKENNEEVVRKRTKVSNVSQDDMTEYRGV